MVDAVKVKYAHRGLHGNGVAENSMTAFRLAAEAGYGIELDVRLTKDGRLVVFHDDTLDRVTNGTGRVDAYDYSEIKELSLLGTEDGIPLFSEVLSLIDGRVPLLIELKEDAFKYGVTEKTLEELCGYSGSYVIESFNPLALGRVKKNAPKVCRGVLCMNYMKEEKYRKPMYFLLFCFLLNVKARPQFLAYDRASAKDLPFRLVRALFRTPSFAWTVRSEQEEREAYENGFDSIIFENYLPETDK